MLTPEHTERTTMPISTGVNHIATMTADLDRAVAFYTEVFDADVIGEIHGSDDHPRMITLDLGGGSALNVGETSDEAIVGDRRTAGARGPIDHYGIAVDSRTTLEAVRTRLTNAGVDIGEIHQLGDIWSLFFRDPDGMELEVCAPVEDAGT
jgi:catechol 2,3-dioxygenase-like lactoylglutathione lyase family enzyme